MPVNPDDIATFILEPHVRPAKRVRCEDWLYRRARQSATTIRTIPDAASAL